MKTRGLLHSMIAVVAFCALSTEVVWGLDATDTLYGTGAGASLTSGINNTFIGYEAGFSTTSAGGNTFLGYHAGYDNTGPRNTFIGGGAGANNTIGTDNTFIGRNAGLTHSTGKNNTFVGSDAGLGQNGLNINGNVFLGYGAGYSETGSNMLYIDNCFYTTNAVNPTTPVYPACDFPFIRGGFDTRLLEIDGTLIMMAVAVPSDERYKRDIRPLESSLEKILHLQGVSYEWKTDEHGRRGFKEGRQIGLIAQEVEKVLPELVQADSKGYKALSYDKLVPVLVEAVKEHQEKISNLQEVIDEKDARIEKLEQDNERIAKVLEKLALQIAVMEGSAKSLALK